MAIPVKLNVFEGPLDLLLHLIDKNKIDIYDNKFDLALEMSNANTEILDEGVRIYNNEKEILLDNNGKVITK